MNWLDKAVELGTSAGSWFTNYFRTAGFLEWVYAIGIGVVIIFAVGAVGQWIAKTSSDWWQKVWMLTIMVILFLIVFGALVWLGDRNFFITKVTGG